MRGVEEKTTCRKIDIDFDVHKCIESARRSFEETPNDVLRRLLNSERRNRHQRHLAPHHHCGGEVGAGMAWSLYTGRLLE